MDNNLPTEFDLIVVGTGVVESIISAAASRVGKKVLHLDNKSYYGGHWASFNLEDIQNVAREDESISESITKTELPQGFVHNEEIFEAFGNGLGKLGNFQISWHVPEKSKQIEAHDKEDPLEQDETQKEMHETSGNDAEDKIVCDVAKEIGECTLNEETEKSKPTLDQESKIITQDFLKKEYRKFIIDLCPKLHFARGDFVELLISSNIARYSEFRSVSRVLTWINGHLEVVPCSRSDVFANNKVSVVEKRMLMKLLTSIEEDEKNTTVPTGTTYKNLLKSKKLSDNIIHFVLYALSMSNDETLWLDGIRGTKRFLHSLGRFGKTPFLFSMYGSGEVAQAFCRLSAVFGGIFALNQPLHGFLVDSAHNFKAIICGTQRIMATHMVVNVDLLPQHFLEETEMNFISRAVFVTDRSLMDSEREHLTLLLYPTKNKKLCRILELGTLTGTSPKDLFLVHITASGTSCPKEDLQECVENLFTTDGDPESVCQKPRILWSCYFSIPDTNEQKFKITLPKNVFPCPGPDNDLDYDFSVKKAREIFTQIYPDDEFLPRAPDAEEIVIEEEPEAASEAKDATNNENNPIEIVIEEEPEAASEAKDATNNENNPIEIEEGSENSMVQSTTPEVAMEAKASNAELNSYKDAEVKGVEECSEVKENTQ